MACFAQYFNGMLESSLYWPSRSAEVELVGFTSLEQNLSYTTMPSFQITPSRNLWPILTERHGIGKHFGSSSHGSAPTTFFAKNSISSRLRAIGPLTELTASWPANADLALAVGKRPNEGLRVYMPVHAAGIRRDPPITTISNGSESPHPPHGSTYQCLCQRLEDYLGN
jgi:hypothetical protein